MAHFATLLMMPVDKVAQHHTRESISDATTQSFGCSHFIAAHPRINPILNAGTPLDTEMWHPIARPHYHLPAVLPAAIATLEDVEATEPDIRKDEWVLAEIHKLRDACSYAVANGLAMVVFLSNTLSRPPIQRRG
jgi:hypothetical protein